VGNRNHEQDEELEVSDADSDDFRLKADIAKLDADVAAFKASMAADSSDEEEDWLDPRLAMGSGLPRKRKPKRPRLNIAPGAKRRAATTRGSNIATPSADIMVQLTKASEAWGQARFEEALEITLEIIRVNAETWDAWVMLASIYEETGNMAEAIMAKCFAAHLRPRDFDGWLNCAHYALDDVTPGQRETNLATAQLCFSAAIKANPKSLKARVGKANCALEAGNSNVAAAEYSKVLKRRPYDMVLLRNMAEAAFDARNAKRYVEEARGYYENLIKWIRSGGQPLRGDFEWSDVIIFVEMCAFLEKYSDATLALRSLARMLIGRAAEEFWDRFEDDREWDQDEERRLNVPEYDPHTYSQEMYGPALPLDLRAKLVIYRLKLQQEEEATRHMQWLDSQDPEILAFFHDTPFIIKDLANELFEARRIKSALEFYDLYLRLAEEPDAGILVQQGKCHLEMEDQATAEECFIAAIEIDDDNIEARYELAQMYETNQEQEEAFLLVNEALQLERDQKRDARNDGEGDGGNQAKPTKKRVRQKVLRDRAARPKRARRVYVRRMANKAQREKYEESVTNNFREKYQRVLELREQVKSGNKAAEEEWMAAAQDLVDDFRSFKEFYPWDKYLNFMGYGSFFQENRRKREQLQQQQEQQEAQQQEAQQRETADGEQDAGDAAEPNNELEAMAERLQQSKSLFFFFEEVPISSQAD
jgi:general transcription factor 3C polypeptide 3 (transcription factor C subunit 4)